MQNAQSMNKNGQTIRNLPAFLKSYTKSESFQRSLTRQPKFIERQAENSKGRIVHWKEVVGFNTLAHALADATARL